MAEETLGQLKQDFLEADREYQFALASHDDARLTKALSNWRKTWNAYDRAKRAQFKKTFKRGNSHAY